MVPDSYFGRFATPKYRTKHRAQRFLIRRFVERPHESWFMLSNLVRGKNVTRFGNDPEHVNHWGSSSFHKLLSERLNVLRMVRSYPWLLALCAPK